MLAHPGLFPKIGHAKTRVLPSQDHLRHEVGDLSGKVREFYEKELETMGLIRLKRPIGNRTSPERISKSRKILRLVPFSWQPVTYES